MFSISKVALILLVLPSAVLAEGSAVTKVNYSLSGGYLNFHGDSYHLTGRAAMPIGESFGAFFTGGYRSNNYKESYVDSSVRTIGCGIFAGGPEKGRAGVTYSKSNSDYEPNTSNFEIDVTTYAIDLDWYLENLSLGIERSFYRASADAPSVDFGSDYDGSMVSASYYYNENSKVSITIGGMDTDDFNEASLEILPESFNKKTSIELSYVDKKNDHSVGFTIRYYFTDSVSLLDRDRRY